MVFGFWASVLSLFLGFFLFLLFFAFFDGGVVIYWVDFALVLAAGVIENDCFVGVFGCLIVAEEVLFFRFYVFSICLLSG